MNFDGWKNTGPKLSLIDIKNLESILAQDLPCDYKRMLLMANGGYPSKSIISIPGTVETVIKEFYGLGKHTSLDLAQIPELEFVELPSGYIPIGHDVGGNHIALDSNGSVYWKDHELINPQSGLIKIAESFEALIDLLKEEPPEVDDPVEHFAKQGAPCDLNSYLSGGNKIDVQSKMGRTLCQELARYGNLAVLMKCVELGASVEGAIHLAAMNGHLDVVRYLVEELGVDVNGMDNNGRSPRMCAFLNPEVQDYLDRINEQFDLESSNSQM